MNLERAAEAALQARLQAQNSFQNDVTMLHLLTVASLLDAPRDSAIESAERSYLTRKLMQEQLQAQTPQQGSKLPFQSILAKNSLNGAQKVNSPPLSNFDAEAEQQRQDRPGFSTGLNMYKKQANQDNRFGLNRGRAAAADGPMAVMQKSEVKPPSKRRVFVPPLKAAAEAQRTPPKSDIECWAEGEGLDMALVTAIQSEVIDRLPAVQWADIAGLHDVKRVIDETIIFPALRPDIFTGLRRPARGILLFGPPGTGKTMIGRAIAGQLKCTFYAISASSLTSKWVGESERLIKTLFRLAAFTQPSVVFVDEIDSLLSNRAEGEMDVVRRIKTEFFVQLDGARTDEDDRVLVIGTTNRPDQLDEAARRRFGKKLYVPLPDRSAKRELLLHEIDRERTLGFGYALTDESIEAVLHLCEQFSCADMKALLKEAAMEPVRELATARGNCAEWNLKDLPPVTLEHFRRALKRVKPTVTADELSRYRKWNCEFGSGEADES